MTLTEDAVFKSMRRTWQPVGNSADLPAGRVTGYTLLETELVIARFANGQVLAADVACPHKGARLSQGCIRDGDLMCPYHGWKFDAGGACRSIPSLLEPNAGKQALSHLRTYAVQERYGFIWVQLEPGPLADGREHALPPVPEFEDPRWAYRMGPPMAFAAGWRREVENYLDMTHFAFAHSGTLGVSADPRIRGMEIKVTPDGGYQMDAPFPALETAHEMPGKLQSAHHRQQRSWLPNFTTIRQRFTDGDERVLVHIPSPNTRESCTCFWSLAISPGFRGPPPEAQMDFAIKVLEEDRRMCEMQLPREVPINPARGGWGVLVMPGDTLANTFQKQLRRWLAAGAAD
ncbi:aromatic ring-hydroxylating dioxygenase subunit alpha [Opitutus sp. GAS368]|jgi:phenylpropionate dioxygenase-like ring-hydroxylating dioxygenase large terminal subunit|uniref:aromatic ring-hydroxylating oxygenase subunit alpha n=1 Tax=Opitutus sp. GAS368 TaxID=1882749 RepID=UPI000879A032|nr:aromatic ring-hydroxylating dioxygenase subunit alpha [Opitutus sp. GAS368]SDR84326.1 Phenylpropionate dioxygenase, large terminal subunit [Opitutus sp. GAS368]